MPTPLIVDLTRATADGVVEGNLAYSDLDDLKVEVGRIIEVSDLGAGPYKAEVVEVDGDRIRVKAPAFKPRPVKAGSPELVDAADLVQWADRPEARYKFPEAIRLLLAGTPGVTTLSVRGGAGGDLSGWDVLVECVSGAPYVPSGGSAWEIGTGRNPAGKAKDDYRKRTKDPGGIDPAETAFVFVTPGDGRAKTGGPLACRGGPVAGGAGARRRRLGVQLG